MHPLYILSTTLTALFVALIVWDFVMDALADSRARARHREATEGARAHLRPLSKIDRVRPRGGMERLRRAAPKKVVARRRTFVDGQTGSPRSLRYPKRRLGR